MADILFDGTFDDWRRRARQALVHGRHPSTIQWRSAEDAQERLFGETELDHAREDQARLASLRLSRQTLTTLESAACYRDEERWDLLYRVVWRLTHGEPALVEDVLDPDMRRVLKMDKQIRRDVHKMHAFVRFREVRCADDSLRYIAWFEPAHDIVLRAAPFFTRRFPSMHWSILTPYISVHWDGTALVAGPGATRSDAPGGDDLEALWATYYSNIFNPARIKVHAMQAEMPKRYWINLPEASLIELLLRDAPGRVARFQEAAQKDERKRQQMRPHTRP